MSLVEIFLALFLTGIVTAAMFKVYINQHHAWIMQDNVIEMQQNARASIDELTRQLRMTGYGLPNGFPPFEAYDTDPDTIIVYYRSSGDCEAPIEHAMPNVSAELRCDGHDISCFQDGATAYIWDPFVETGEFFVITEVQVAAMHIQHNTTAFSRTYPSGSLIIMIDRVKYYIDQSDTDHPKLMVQVGAYPPQVYAEDIIDLQFTYTLKNGATVDTPILIHDTRQIGITVTARTWKEDVEIEDMPYRFEVYNSEVNLRNLNI